MTEYQPEHLVRWTHPDSYFGATWEDYFSSGVGQHRVSDALARSNFKCMLEKLGGESDTVTLVHESHWAVGWVEWIAIHESDEKALRIADEIVADLKQYPVIDEDHFSQEEQDEADSIWKDCYLWRERVEYIRDHRSQFDFKSFGDLLSQVRGEYFDGYASELLC